MIEHYKKYYKIHARRSVSCILDIISELNKRIDVNNSLIIVVADHGNHSGEKGRIYHGYYLTDELLRVPLYVKYPENVKYDSKIKEGYISLTFLYNLIKSLLYNESFQANNLPVVSESYGPQHPLPKIKSYFSLPESELKKYYSHRIRLSMHNRYLVYDVDKDLSLIHI